MSASVINRSSHERAWRHLADLFSVLFSRDLKILYKRSSLGFGWALVTPLLQLFIFSFHSHPTGRLSLERKNGLVLS